MPFAAQRAYLERLERRQAEFKIVVAEAVALPQTNPRERMAILQHWQRTAAGPQGLPPKPAPRGALALRGIFVEFVPLKQRN